MLPVKWKQTSNRDLKSQNNAFYKSCRAFKTLFGDLNNLLLCDSCEPKKCSFNMNLPLFFWCLKSIMTHDAKLSQISYKTNFWVLRCKKKVRFLFHFFFQLNFFFLLLPRKLVNFWIVNEIQTNLRRWWT